MTRRLVLLALGAAGCGVTSYQSARVLAPGRTEVVVAITRLESVGADGGGDDEGQEMADVMVRHGLGKLDVGARWTRLPVVEVPAESLLLDLKAALAPGTVAVSFGAGPFFTEGPGMEEADYLGLALEPALLFSSPLSPTAEFEGGVKAILFFPDGGDESSFYALTAGLRLSPDLGQWALHPEIGLSDGEDLDGVVLHFGMGVAADF